MNSDSPSDFLSHEIDLLVDGELPEERRADLFAHLETNANGWKHCALRFLEMQAWQEAMNQPEKVIPIRAKRPWFFPLSSVAAAVIGFFLALFVNSEKAPDLTETSSEKDTMVRYIPVPIEQSHGLTPVSNQDGEFYYTTRNHVPVVLLNALEEAGHDIQHIQRFVLLPQENGSSLELPITETRIHLNHQL